MVISGFKERVILQNQEMFGITPNFENSLCGASSIPLNEMSALGDRERQIKREREKEREREKTRMRGGLDAWTLEREGINN